MESEIKNTVYIAITCSLLAIILGFVMIMTNIKDTMATARNEEIIGKEQIAEYNSYNTYDGKWITGMQLVRLITESSSKDLEIFVTFKKSSKVDYADIDKNGDTKTQKFNNSLYIRYPEVYEVNTNGDTATITNCPLVELYASNTVDASTGKYYCYLVYDNEDVSKATEKNYAGNSKVSGVVVEYWD